MSFPIDREIPFWPHWTFAEAFFLWFIFISPITIFIGFVVYLKRRKHGRIRPLIRFAMWTTLTLSLVVNGFMLLGLWAAFYY